MMGRTRFWEEPINVIDTLDVGLRSGYVATVLCGSAHASLSPWAGRIHLCHRARCTTHSGLSYGVPKAGVDKMAADMAFDFKDFGIASISIWMGSLLTDRVRKIIATKPEKFSHILDTAETPELTGHVLWAIFNDSNRMALSGQTLIGAELAIKYGIEDEGGRRPPSYRDMFDVHPRQQAAHVMR